MNKIADNVIEKEGNVGNWKDGKCEKIEMCQITKGRIK
jgi:hypothetical protein